MDLIESGINNPIKHWYYNHKFSFIKKFGLIDPINTISLVDIGAGSALFSRELIRLKLIEKAVAVDTGYLEDLYDRTERIHYCRSSSYEDFTHFLLTDVLEHIDQDEDFLSNIVAQSQTESKFIITVPALMSLWSDHDVFLKHFRRYTKSELISLAEKSGLEVVLIRYIYSTVFPIAYAQRKFSRRNSGGSYMKQDSRLVSSILRLALIPDRWISQLPFGVSLFMVAKKVN
jgi:hypothetical protein